MAIILITTIWASIASMCQQIIVMYGGRICERGNADEIFYNPSRIHQGAAAVHSERQESERQLIPIAGSPVDCLNMPAGAPLRHAATGP